MANHEDQRIDPLEQAKPEVDEEMIDQFAEELKKQKLDELKRRAFYSVLLAFRVETLTLGNCAGVAFQKRDQIIEKLMNEWSIAQETRISFEANIQKNLVAHQQRVESQVKETKIVEGKPLITRLPEKKPSWGEALLGRRVLVRMPDEDEFEDLLIIEFNANDGMHRLVTVDPNVMWKDESLSWMDVRKVPVEDIKWSAGEDPNFETPGLGA